MIYKEVHPYLLIALSGAPRAGKDTAARMLKHLLIGRDSSSGNCRIVSAEVLSFAQDLYELGSAVLSHNPTGRTSENVPVGHLQTYKVTYRPFLKELSALVKRYSHYKDLVFVRHTESRIRALLSIFWPGPRGNRLATAVILSDLRLQSESALLDHYSGIEILIRNPEAEASAVAQNALEANDPYESRWYLMKDLPENFDPKDGPLVVFTSPDLEAKLASVVNFLLLRSESLNGGPNTLQLDEFLYP